MGGNAPFELALVAAVLASAGVAGCDRPSPGADAGSPAGFTVRDSGDIEIVENHAPEYPPGQFWTLDAEPEIVLGGGGGGEAPPGGAAAQNPAQLIWQVVGVARLEDGRVAVLSQGNHQLYLFEPSGELSSVIGGRGEGPGEFDRPQLLQYLAPDTLVVWDYWFAPASYFDTGGALLRERSIDLLKLMARVPGTTAESHVIPFVNGSFVVLGGEEPASPPPAGAFYRPPVDLALVDSTYTARPLGSWAVWQLWIPETTAHRDDAFLMILLVDQHIATGGDPPSIYIGDGDRNVIYQFSQDGSLLRIIRRAAGPVPVTDRGHQSWLATLESLNEGMESAFGMSWEELTRGMPRREAYPAVAGLAVDADGHLWVREWSPAETGMPDQWSVFSPEGRWLGVVRGVPELFLCNRISPCWVDRDFLLAVRRDELGVERVEGYRIRRDGGAESSATRNFGTAARDPARARVPP
ncbi:MAG: hypothetical protein OXI71_13360 [Gemmatimonadota bacterium]|nr:hypothetical protein [Gemmatimonadota bacterium]